MNRKNLTLAFGALMIVAGAAHFLRPSIYTPFIPAPLPARAIVYASGVVEIAVGLMTLLHRTRQLGAIGIFVLMVAFSPLHVLDVFREDPVVGSPALAFVRLPLQVIFVAWAWAIADLRGALGRGIRKESP